MTKRNHMWDNIKGFLIITVVVGHLLHSFDCPAKVSYNFAYWIYTFHMPAFLFISGFFAKGYCKDGVVKPEKVVYLICYYTIFQLILFAVDFLFFNPQKTFSFFDAMLGLWYLSAMIFYYLFLPLFEKIPPIIGIAITVILGLLIGLDAKAGDYFSISRTFVFAPFFFVGYYTQEKSIEKLHRIKCGRLIGVLSILISVPLWLFPQKSFPDNLLENNMINPFLFYGHTGYEKMNFSVSQGMFMRIFAYATASLMIFGILLIAPRCKSFLCHIGKNSLQIYLFHLIPILIFVRMNSQDISFLVIDKEWIGFALILIGIAFSFFLSLPIFTYPFRWMRLLTDKILSLKQTN